MKYTVSPQQIQIMEQECGEWIIDLVDISLALNDLSPNLKMKIPLQNLFQEKYPQIYAQFMEQEEGDSYSSYDLTEFIRDLKGLPEGKYQEMYAEIYNLHPAFQEFFQEQWQENDFDELLTEEK